MVGQHQGFGTHGACAGNGVQFLGAQVAAQQHQPGALPHKAQGKGAVVASTFGGGRGGPFGPQHFQPKAGGQVRDNALAMVRQATPGAVEAALMAAIDKPWATKAFYEKSLETRSAAKPTAMPRFTAYVELGSGRLAVIDGYEYQAGDTLEGGGYTVRTVSPDRVTLESLANGQPLELPYDGLESQSR